MKIVGIFVNEIDKYGDEYIHLKNALYKKNSVPAVLEGEFHYKGYHNFLIGILFEDGDNDNEILDYIIFKDFDKSMDESIVKICLKDCIKNNNWFGDYIKKNYLKEREDEK